MKKSKKIISLILFTFAILLFGVSTLLSNTQNNNNEVEKPILSKYEMSNLINGYVIEISNLSDYAKQNKKEKFTINELKVLFNIDISEIEQYDCNLDNTFIMFNETFEYFNTYYDCSFITPNFPE